HAMISPRFLLACLVTLLFQSAATRAAESLWLETGETLWLEAESFTGITGHCWPMAMPGRRQTHTDGHWGLAGPGWAAEWNQGGESGFLSIACSAEDDHAVVTREVEVPVAGDWVLWVRYGDWREATERFQVRIEQAGAAAQEARFGERA